ncbi:MAG: hypothetical protein D8M58_05485 [Calditrichaeota bacterium]|nr:MAG: hypothetical protein DWQ03_21020 [Calditrichota bacterium]MBL1204828.1 hypothetical protein [Calditrichota bacterium]NOG44657.1 hypothetical protein [Calditrichota bacterium]
MSSLLVSKHQIKRMFKNQKKIIFLLMFFAFMVEFFFTVILSTSTIRQFAESYFKLMPPMVKQMLGFMGDGFVSSQFIAFGFGHPALLFILCFVSISIAGRYITAEIEGRSIELLAIRILPRNKIIFSTYFFILITILAIYFSMISGSFLGGEIMGVSDDVPFMLLIKMAGIGILFFAAISAIVTFISSIHSERGMALAWNIGLILFLFVFDALIRLWPKVSFLKPYSLFNWYQPVNIATGKYNLLIGIPLLSIILISFLIATVYKFNRRDL